MLAQEAQARARHLLALLKTQETQHEAMSYTLIARTTFNLNIPHKLYSPFTPLGKFVS